MSEFNHRISSLSPEKRAIFERYLREQDTAVHEEPKIPRREASEHVPLSYAQQRLWFLDQFETGSPVYNITKTFEIIGLIDAKKLEMSLNKVVQHHESLRTIFSVVRGDPVQIILPSLTLKLLLIDLREIPETLRQTELLHLIAKEARCPFDLTKAPLLRVTLLRLHEDNHILLVTVHHIVSDGWSMGVLFREISLLYNSFCAGTPSSLPELPVQYADFAVWQRQWLQDDILADQLSYWKKHLAGILPVLELPFDRPRPPIQAFHGKQHRSKLPMALVKALKAMSRKEEITLFMLALAVFNILLYRYTGQEDIIVGSPIANRNRSEIEDLIGFFVNTLILRTDLSGNPIIREILCRIREVCLGAYEHQDLPFDKLVEELQPKRTQSHSPIFNVMFAFQNTPQSSPDLNGLSFNQLEIDNGTAKFDLALSMFEKADELHMIWEYNTDLFYDTTIERMAGHFQTLLEGIVSNPDCSITELQLLTAPERDQLLHTWNNTERQYPSDKCIQQIFENHVRMSPEAVAVIEDDRRLTYARLNRRANQLANHLLKLNIMPETLVGICIERSIEMIIVMLGILKAGGAYLPLDHSYPQERLSFMLEDSQASLLITQKKLGEFIPDTKARIVYLDDNKALEQESEENPPCKTEPDKLAYVMYTSGSTGRPKGVAVSHRAIMRLVVGTDYLQLTEEDVVAQAANVCFDAATWEIWGPLANGGRVVLIPTDILLSPEGLAAAIDRHGITAMFVTTTLFNRIAEDAPYTFARLNALLFGGEASDPKSATRVLSNKPPRQLIHVYGPTEATTFATWHLVESIPKDGVTIPIGKPIANTTAQVMDRYNNPVPIGVKGELYIGGPGLARGYLNQPELTAEKFVTLESGERFYKTGDRALRLRDGTIEFVGRLDDQLKIRGFRIEPGEVAAVLRGIPDIKEAAVIAREDNIGEKRLVAYIVPENRHPPPPEALRNYLKGKLPDFMVPAVFLTLEFLPLTPSGKLDRGSLPVPSWNQVQRPVDSIAPRTATEKRLAAVWREVLGISEQGMHDNFFDIGGYSLLGARLVTYIRTEFQADIPLRQLFESPTIAEMAAWIDADMLNRDGGQSVAGSPGRSLIRIQEGLASPPLFFVPGGGGEDSSLMVYARLARQMGPDIPFYGFLACGLDGKSHPHTSVRKMAAAYISEIRSQQPFGPYFLAGECVGGIAAFEIARQLESSGEQVALVALLDTYCPSPYHYLTTLCKRLSHRLKRGLRTIFNSSAEGLLLRTLHEIERMIIFTGDEVGFVWPNRKPDSPEARQWYMHRVQETYQRVLCRHRPGRYAGNIILLVSENNIPEKMAAGWRSAISGNIDIHTLPGTHIEYIRDHSQTVGRVLRDCFDQSRQEGQREKA